MLEAEEPEVTRILKDGEAFGEKNAPEGIRVVRGASYLYFDTRGDEDQLPEISRLKKQTASYLMKKYKKRKFRHSSYRGKELWQYYVSNTPKGWRVGIKVDLTDDEADLEIKGHLI